MRGGPNSPDAAGDPSIRAVGFIASIKSPYLEFQIRQSESERARLDAFLAKTRELVAQGIGGEPVAFENWFPNRHMAMAAAHVPEKWIPVFR